MRSVLATWSCAVWLSVTALPAEADDPTDPYEILAKVRDARGAEHFPPGVDSIALQVRYRIEGGPDIDARGVFSGWSLVLSATSQGGKPLEAFSAVSRECRHRMAAGNGYEPCDSPRLLPVAFDHWTAFLLGPLAGGSPCQSFELLPRLALDDIRYFVLTCAVRDRATRLTLRFWVNPQTWRVDVVDRESVDAAGKAGTQHLRLSDYREFMGVMFPRAVQFMRAGSREPVGTLRVISIGANPAIDLDAEREPRLIDVTAGAPAKTAVAPDAPVARIDLETLVAQNSAALGGAAALRAWRARAADLDVKYGDDAVRLRLLVTRQNEILLESPPGASPQMTQFDDGKQCWTRTGTAPHATACAEDVVANLREFLLLDSAFSLEALRPLCEREFALTTSVTPGRGLRTVRCAVSESYLLMMTVNPRSALIESFEVITLTPEGALYERREGSYEDYRRVGTLLWPHMRRTGGEFTTIRHMSLDPPVDRRRFERP